MAGIRLFLFYMLGVILSLLLTIHKIKSEYGDELDKKDFDPIIFSLKYTFYVISSWIGLVDMIIDSVVEYFKYKSKRNSDEEISEWFKK